MGSFRVIGVGEKWFVYERKVGFEWVLVGINCFWNDVEILVFFNGSNE